MPERTSRRLRRIGLSVLAIGWLAAGATYWIQTAHHEPTPEELISGYAEANERQMGILYGQTGAAFLELLQDLAEPGPEAVMIAAASAFIAWRLFRSAQPSGDTNPARRPTDR